MHIDSYFTHQTDVRQIIIEHLDNATSKVLVAVAWFTDQLLFQKLVELQDRGVSIELIITKHEFNTQSRNNYEVLEQEGFFAEIGSDEQLMHMKFCVIDYDIVISGSANWSNKAFSTNNEEVTIVSGSLKRANDFIEEFERLKQLSGKIKQQEQALDVSRAMKYFKLIKALIDVGDTRAIQPYVHELKKLEKLQPICQLLMNGQYDLALEEIEKFEKLNSQVIDLTLIMREQIVSQIRLFSFQIEVLEIEKTEIEAKIEQFNHRYIIELNPLITKILALKRKIYKKLEKHGIKDDTYEKIEEDFRRKQEEYEEEKKVDIPNLNEQETKDLKKMHREAVKFCHPDSPSCIYEDKIKAAEVFARLTEAVKKNDLKTVQYIWNELQSGNAAFDLESRDQLKLLKAKLETIKANFNYLLHELASLKALKTYKTISAIEDWEEYFQHQKRLLEEEYKNLSNKYVTHE